LGEVEGSFLMIGGRLYSIARPVALAKFFLKLVNGMQDNRSPMRVAALRG
jgi:hypothetical protein